MAEVDGGVCRGVDASGVMSDAIHSASDLAQRVDKVDREVLISLYLLLIVRWKTRALVEQPSIVQCDIYFKKGITKEHIRHKSRGRKEDISRVTGLRTRREILVYHCSLASIEIGTL